MIHLDHNHQSNVIKGVGQVLPGFTEALSQAGQKPS
jgi:hypothetical protein